MHALKKVVWLLVIAAANTFCSQVDLVVFSYDRPLQLYAYLESVEKYITGCASVAVVYRFSNEQYAQAYEKVKERFSNVCYLAQGDNPKDDFKKLTIQAVQAGKQDYILFGVDDIIAKDYVDLTLCTNLLRVTGAYGFYLSLGTHLSYCYPLQCNQAVPKHEHVRYGVQAWTFSRSEADWNYPNTVDMTVYKKSEILHDILNLNYYSPNSFESEWSKIAHKIMHKTGLFFEHSKVVNLPLNRVQNDFHNVNMNLLTAAEMLDIFNQGLKIDINQLYHIENKSRHMEYVPSYVQQ